MRIEASVRPLGIKRGVSDKKLANSLGLEHADLRDMVGRLRLSVTRPQEFAFLRELHKALNSHWHKSSKVTIEIDGNQTITFSHDSESVTPNQGGSQ